MTPALAIMVKTPGHSRVKTRLAAGRGEDYALEWHRRAAAAVASVATQLTASHGASVYWAVAEAGAHEAWTGLPVLAQGEGGLGRRMGQVQAQLVARHGAGILLGADTPQLDGESLGDALAWLTSPSPRLLMGPARDGGFWLFGANVSPALQIWESVRYSAPDTAAALREAMQALGAWRLLATMTDVDEAGDLDEVERALAALPCATAEQQVLAAWMRGQAQMPA